MIFPATLVAGASDPAWALFLCAVMAAGLIAYTFYVPAEIDRGTEKTRLAYLKERKEQVYENLRDLNFEHKAGKLPDADYEQMHVSLEREAASLLAEIERLESTHKNGLYRGLAGNLNKPNSSKGA